MARTATGKNSAKAGAGLTKGNGKDILDKDERLDELYDDPESDVALVSKDGVVFKYYSGMLKKKSKFFTDLFATPYAPAPFVEPENGEMIPDVFSTPARRVVLTFSTDCISTYLGILNSRKSTLPDMSPSAFEEQFDLGALFQHDMLIGRLLALLSIDARLDAFLAFRLAARHPVVEDKLLRHAFARLQDQTTRGHCAMSYEQYTAAIALRSVFSPLYPGKDTTLKGWEWVQDAAEVENFIKAVHTPTTESAVEGPAKKKAKK